MSDEVRGGKFYVCKNCHTMQAVMWEQCSFCGSKEILICSAAVERAEAPAQNPFQVADKITRQDEAMRREIERPAQQPVERPPDWDHEDCVLDRDRKIALLESRLQALERELAIYKPKAVADVGGTQ